MIHESSERMKTSYNSTVSSRMYNLNCNEFEYMLDSRCGISLIVAKSFWEFITKNTLCHGHCRFIVLIYGSSKYRRNSVNCFALIIVVIYRYILP